MKTALPAPLNRSLGLALLAGQLASLAQPAPPCPESPPPLTEAGAEVASALAEAGRQLQEARARLAAALAQAGEAGQQAFATLHLAAAPPVPPQPPLGDDAPLWAEAGGAAGGAGAVIQWLGGEPPGNVPQALIVPAGDLSAVQVAELREDLAVFSRILGKAAGEERRRGQEMALGIVVSTFPTLRRPEALYLEGYGAVLLLNVPFPLAAPEEPRDEPAPDKPADSVWERTRRELFGGQPGSPTPPPPGALPRLEWDLLLPGAKPAPYDARRVEKLRQDLVEALQHGTHLRHIKPEEHLVLVVTGTSAAPRSEVRIERRLGRGGAAESRREKVVVGDAVPGAETLVLRVKKADADALAEGKISLDEFRQRVSVRQY